jgi:nicotinamide-nucleotide amidase
MFHPGIYDLSRRIIESYTVAKKKIVTAESCTGGLVGAALTQIPGSSEVMERGFISYSNDAKIELLGVPPDILADYGAVSAQVSEAMAQGALEFSRADVAVSVTGVAGPGGGTSNKPIGLVYIGLANREGAVFHYRNEFKGDRDDIRAQAMQEALNLLLSMVKD